MHKFQSTDTDWPFTYKYLKSIGLKVSGFQIMLSNLPNLLKSFFLPSANLINIESGTEQETIEKNI